MEHILNIFKKDPKLQELIRAPMLSDGDKKQIVQEIMKQSGAPDKDNVVKNFLDTLSENNRLGVLEQVCEKFSTLMSAYRGEAELVVTSAAVSGHSCSQILSLQRIKSLTQVIAT
jgi:F-type H+-transporting ATPase subunit O